MFDRLNISKRHWNALLAGERNASPKLALRIERLTGIPKEVFVFGTGASRRAAWNKAKEAQP